MRAKERVHRILKARESFRDEATYGGEIPLVPKGAGSFLGATVDMTTGLPVIWYFEQGLVVRQNGAMDAMFFRDIQTVAMDHKSDHILRLTSRDGSLDLEFARPTGRFNEALEYLRFLQRCRQDAGG